MSGMKKPDSQTFRVADEQVNQTISAALRLWLPGTSWSDIRRLLAARHVTVSGNLCLDEGRRLKAEEVVKLLEHPAPAPPKEDDVRIRYIDAHLVVVEKPAGMTTLRHPEERNWPKRRKQLQPTLDELLPRIIQKKERGPGPGKSPRGVKRPPAPQRPAKQAGPRRLRAVHRIDRETSGLMVFARTVDAERLLGLQFRKHELHRVYVAVALGHVQEQTFESRLVDDRGDGRRGSTKNSKLGKVAVTHVRPLERLDGYTVVECRLETGRTHQIRIHLSEAGHPLCGDKVYRGPFPGKPAADESGAPRVALHAAELGFEHPLTGEKLKFVMPLPSDLSALIDRLRQRGKPAKTQSKPARKPPRRQNPPTA
ncbi:MAG: RluA family pseudouridine synthase [Planctomycetes bacterium]|nr:RluA family pseudouridine synthase [Planctomycetota bacterium]